MRITDFRCQPGGTRAWDTPGGGPVQAGPASFGMAGRTAGRTRPTRLIFRAYLAGVAAEIRRVTRCKEARHRLEWRAGRRVKTRPTWPTAHTSLVGIARGICGRPGSRRPGIVWTGGRAAGQDPLYAADCTYRLGGNLAWDTRGMTRFIEAGIVWDGGQGGGSRCAVGDRAL